ncbi:MAG: hypothetical protein LBE16_09465 [Clostridiales Family XIII bacterium]|nr:hypothetical protein [Clostridiales Family XIII bacterium]
MGFTAPDTPKNRLRDRRPLNPAELKRLRDEFAIENTYDLNNGDAQNLDSYATKAECFDAAKAFCDEQIKTDEMTRREADEILRAYR